MIILVTGLMRTGTSLLSKQLHLMGVPMGTEMRFPINGQEDWEDVIFTDKMLARLDGRDSTNKKEFIRWLRQYEKARNVVKNWGVKSPFALPFIEDIRKAFCGELKVILTSRNEADMYASLYRQPVDKLRLLDLQNQLQTALANVKFDLIIDITESWNNPEAVKIKLQELIRS